MDPLTILEAVGVLILAILCGLILGVAIGQQRAEYRRSRMEHPAGRAIVMDRMTDEEIEWETRAR